MLDFINDADTSFDAVLYCGSSTMANSLPTLEAEGDGTGSVFLSGQASELLGGSALALMKLNKSIAK